MSNQSVKPVATNREVRRMINRPTLADAAHRAVSTMGLVPKKVNPCR